VLSRTISKNTDLPQRGLVLSYWRSSVHGSTAVVCSCKNWEKDGQRKGTNLVLFHHLPPLKFAKCPPPQSARGRCQRQTRRRAQIVFKSPVWSGFLVLMGLNRNRNRSAFSQKLKRPDWTAKNRGLRSFSS
jgi:hypothetical protein